MLIAFGFVIVTVTEPEAERKQGVRDVVGTFRHTGVLTNAIVGLLYTYGFFTLLAYTPLILDLTTFQLGFVFFAWGLLVIVDSAVLSPRLNRWFGTAEVSTGALVVFAGICAQWDSRTAVPRCSPDSSSLPGSSVDS
ncbi:hypothetical protein [Natrialba sp. PRR66]|uniref:hypothetical protein n=1 Tax=Natrialba sp. PRR66 TaxID=3098146 RepID=UPI002B1E6C54|nr:hypothetical protein [Natrialba sp. PRR66]